jgi:hypothetical protein
MNRIAPPMAAVVLIVAGGTALAQSPFPAPLPGQASEPPMSSLPSNGTPTFGTVPQLGPSRECVDGYTALREDTEAKSKLIKAAADRRASADEACRLIGDFRLAEAKLFKYVEMNVSRCAIPAQLTQQLKAGAEKTLAMETKACTLARQMQKKHTPAGPTGDFWPTSPNAPI